jgi:hypothetical protein
LFTQIHIEKTFDFFFIHLKTHFSDLHKSTRDSMAPAPAGAAAAEQRITAMGQPVQTHTSASQTHSSQLGPQCRDCRGSSSSS